MTAGPAILVLGVDGGASSTRAAVADGAGNVLGQATAGPSNHVRGDAGRLRLRQALEGAVGGALGRAAVALAATAKAAAAGAGAPGLAELRAATLGMTGVHPDTPEAKRVVEELLPLLPEPALQAGLRRRIAVVSDARTALEGAAEGQPGILVYAGTGSVAMGRDAGETIAKAGGWGHLIDDEGGGYTIGRHALRAVFRAHDGRGPHTRLEALVFEHFQVDDLDSLLRVVYTNDGLDRPSVARLARLAARAAAEGDEAALAIYRHAGHELAGLAVVVARRLNMPAPAVYYSGGAFGAGQALLAPFTQAIHDQLPDAQVAPARNSPLVGALLMAFRQLGLSVTPELAARLRAQVDAS